MNKKIIVLFSLLLLVVPILGCLPDGDNGDDDTTTTTDTEVQVLGFKGIVSKAEISKGGQFVYTVEAKNDWSNSIIDVRVEALEGNVCTEDCDEDDINVGENVPMTVSAELKPGRTERKMFHIDTPSKGKDEVKVNARICFDYKQEYSKPVLVYNTVEPSTKAAQESKGPLTFTADISTIQAIDESNGATTIDDPVIYDFSAKLVSGVEWIRINKLEMSLDHDKDYLEVSYFSFGDAYPDARNSITHTDNINMLGKTEANGEIEVKVIKEAPTTRDAEETFKLEVDGTYCINLPQQVVKIK